MKMKQHNTPDTTYTRFINQLLTSELILLVVVSYEVAAYMEKAYVAAGWSILWFASPPPQILAVFTQFCLSPPTNFGRFYAVLPVATSKIAFNLHPYVIACIVFFYSLYSFNYNPVWLLTLSHNIFSTRAMWVALISINSINRVLFLHFSLIYFLL